MFGAALVAGVTLVVSASAPVAAAEARAAAGKELGGKVLASYYEMAAALVADSTAGVAEKAARIAADTGAAAKAGGVSAAEKGALEAIAAAAGRVNGKDLAALRAQFKDFSKAMDGYLRATGTPGWSLYYCPMADGYWLQAAEPVANPYYGKAMLRCGDKVEKIGG
jgi:hypothetical protein